MTWITRHLLVVALASGMAGTAAAQTTTTTGTTTTGTTGTTSGGSGVSGATTNFEAAPVIMGGTASGANVNATNGFAGFYANPLYAGRPGSTGNDTPGGFGTALSGGGGSSTNRSSTGTAANRTSTGSTANRTSTGSTTSGLSSLTGASTGTGTTRTGTTGGANAITGTTTGQGFGQGFNAGTTGTTGRTGGLNTLGGNTGFGGNTRGGLNTGGQQQQAGIIVPQPSPIRYSVAIRFPTPAIVPAQLQADLRGSLDRSSFLTNARGVDVSMNGTQVILRGAVKDEEEARTAEGIIRLTPGVKDVKNELTYPKE